MTLIIFYPFAMYLKCDYSSAGDTRPFDNKSDKTVTRQWWNSDATVMPLISFSSFWDVNDHYFPFAMILKCDYASFGDTRPFDKHSDQTVMLQWCNRDATVMQQWCRLISALLCHLHGFEMLLIVFHLVAMPWGCVWKTVIKQWSNSDETVMWQWWNSDAFDLSFITLFSSFWDVIDHILSFCNALGVCLVTKDPLTKTVNNSDATVMQQWCNSDGSVMPLIWALSHYFQAFEMSLIIIYPFAMPWECVWWHKTIWKNSDQTVMRQWWNSDATVIEQWCLWFEQFDVTYKLLRCHWSFCNL
jgi:hypothetical protein